MQLYNPETYFSRLGFEYLNNLRKQVWMNVVNIIIVGVSTF